jgi:Tol biopolymer transport system component
VAEGSPRTIARLGLDFARRLATRGAAMIALLLAVAGCDPGPAPRPFTIEPFVFASNWSGTWALYRSSGETVVRLSDQGMDDREPNSVRGHLVFTSLRDGDAEIYATTLTGNLTLGPQTRLTNEYGNDHEPALDPSATVIAFVSGRGGAPRIWLMDANGANPRPLDTGSADYVPEGAPRWSPTGDRIAFTSTRTGTSQVYVVPAAGGAALQLSHESRGGFTPSWMPDGQRVLYTSLAGAGEVMSVPAAGGDAAVFATANEGLGEAVCGLRFCLAVASPLGGAGHIVPLTAKGRTTPLVLPQAADDHHPALLGP